MSKAGKTLSPEPILALSTRLSRAAKQARQPHASDLRLACGYLKRLASLMIAEEAQGEKDPALRRQLEAEATALWHEGRHLR